MRALQLAALGWLLLGSSAANAALHVVIVEGLGGEAVYGEEFAALTAVLRRDAAAMTDAEHTHVLTGAQATRSAVQSLFKTLAASASAEDRLALYLVGHGSFDGEEFKFNVAGPDLTGRELATLLGSLPMSDQLIVATGSSSGALQETLKNDKRIIITATRSGGERNVTHFPTELVAALGDSAADIDKNGTLSAQEVFDFTERRVKDYYESEVRLATEHPQLRGERAALFPVARIAVSATDGSDAGAGEAANPAQQAERARINSALDALRLRKSELPEAEYNAKLEELLLQLAAVDAGAATP